MRKIAFYIDPYIALVSNFYTKMLLKREIERVSGGKWRIDICIPKIGKTDSGSTDVFFPYVNINNYKKYGFEIKWGLPSVEDYVGLMVINVYNSKWTENNRDNRVVVANQFQRANKFVVAVKDDLTMDFIKVLSNGSIIYGDYVDKSVVLSNLPKFDKMRLGGDVSGNDCRFILPMYCNLKFEKPGYLSRMDFFKKYGLDTELNLNLNNDEGIKKEARIILFFLPRYLKYQNLCDNFPNIVKVFNWFLNNLGLVVEFLRGMGYHLLFKAHRGDTDNFARRFNGNVSGIGGEDMFLRLCKTIEPFDTYEAIRYSSLGFTCFSNICYELYLQQLPVIELGTGVYYPGWSEDAYNTKYFPVKLPDGREEAVRLMNGREEAVRLMNGREEAVRLMNGREEAVRLMNGMRARDMIYGMVIEPSGFLAFPWSYLKECINRGFNIKKFDLRKKHPLYGNAYKITMVDVANVLIGVFEGNGGNVNITKQKKNKK